MLSSRLCLFILSLVVSTLALQPFHVMSESWGPLITDACSKAPNLNRCGNCLTADPTAEAADMRGLAMISIACGKRYAYSLYNLIYESQTTTDNQRLKQLQTDFYSHLGEIAYNIGNAGPLLQKKGVEAAKESVTVKVKPDMTYCLNLLKNSGEPQLKSYVDEFNLIEDDRGMILEILNKI